MRFRGRYRFCSSFFPSKVVLFGHAYPSAEHAYQAAKAALEDDRAAIAAAPTPGAAKRLGRALPPDRVRPGWLSLRVEVMSLVVLDKFTRDPELGEQLLATGDEYLVEDNEWGDRFWGRTRGRGMNVLGQILMAVRDVLRQRRG